MSRSRRFLPLRFIIFWNIYIKYELRWPYCLIVGHNIVEETEYKSGGGEPEYEGESIYVASYCLRCLRDIGHRDQEATERKRIMSTTSTTYGVQDHPSIRDVVRRETLEEVEAVVQQRIKQEQDYLRSYNGRTRQEERGGILKYIPMEYILQLIKDMPREKE